ncbi:MAG: NFACT RNA binding domain-containing protein [Ignavibacteria bacterium]|nr:NFACT RNA binding domain-containing protein [Ignavibacteria bacterium]
MLNNYYLLYHLRKEFLSIVDAKIVDCFTQTKGILTLVFNNGNEEFCLQFSTLSGLECIFLAPSFPRAKSNTKDFFPEILGEKIISINLKDNDRILQFETKSYDIYFVLFGGSKTNAFLSDKAGKILSSFKSVKVNLIDNINEIIIKKTDKEIKTCFDYLSKNFGFGKFYSEILLTQAGFEKNCEIKSLTSTDYNKLLSLAKDFKENLLNAKNFFIYLNKEELQFSLLELTNFVTYYKSESPSEAVRTYFRTFHRIQKMNNEIEGYKKYLTNELKYWSSLQKKINEVEEVKNKVVKYKHFADLLISYQELNQRGLDKISLEDFDGNNIEIPLKKSKTIKENAMDYYDKSRKAKEAVEKLINSKKEIESKVLELQNALLNLEKLENPLSLDDFRKDFSHILPPEKVKVTNTEEDINSKFRRFEIDKNIYLYVGKSAVNNEELTFKFANPNDFWFHAKNSAGSHCVLKYPKGKVPPKEIFEKAAKIAAYFSKAKNSKYVPVSVTQKKYIRKAKGTTPGTVLLMREEVIFVEPFTQHEIKNFISIS